MAYCISVIPLLYAIDFFCCWYDSSVTLTWIKTSTYCLKVYIANRVSQIQDLISPEHWFHVSMCHNPPESQSTSFRITKPSLVVARTAMDRSFCPRMTKYTTYSVKHHSRTQVETAT